MKEAAEIEDVGEAESRDFCAAIGELILWASFIDGQLNKALMAILVLPAHAMLESIVAQLDARLKAELLKKRAKLISNKNWANGVKNWVERAEKVNGKRNFVAHHSIRVSEGKIVLHSDQLSKIFDAIETAGEQLQPRESKDINDIRKWIELAKMTYTEGATVIENLDRLKDKASKDLATKG